MAFLVVIAGLLRVLLVVLSRGMLKLQVEMSVYILKTKKSLMLHDCPYVLLVGLRVSLIIVACLCLSLLVLIEMTSSHA